MKKTVWIILLMLLPFGSVAFADSRIYRISVSRFATDPDLDAVFNGFQDCMQEKQIKVEYNLHNAHAKRNYRYT